MAENLNEYFSSVFIGVQFIRTTNCNPKMVTMKIRAMKDNKSPGVDGIPHKLLLEIVEQISIRLVTVFNLSLEE